MENILSPQVDEVLAFLNTLQHKIKNRQLTSESYVEKISLSALKQEFEDAHSQFNVGGYFGFKIDIDLFNGGTGIEIKLYNELLNSASNVQRLLGQVLYYSKRRYGKNLIILIVGREEGERNPIIKELKEIICSIDATFLYLKTT
jgi:hypothetical protein